MRVCTTTEVISAPTHSASAPYSGVMPVPKLFTSFSGSRFTAVGLAMCCASRLGSLPIIRARRERSPVSPARLISRASLSASSARWFRFLESSAVAACMEPRESASDASPSVPFARRRSAFTPCTLWLSCCTDSPSFASWGCRSFA